VTTRAFRKPCNRERIDLRVAIVEDLEPRRAVARQSPARVLLRGLVVKSCAVARRRTFEVPLYEQDD
jgi:hypothetical protein